MVRGGQSDNVVSAVSSSETARNYMMLLVVITRRDKVGFALPAIYDKLSVDSVVVHDFLRFGGCQC